MSGYSLLHVDLTTFLQLHVTLCHARHTIEERRVGDRGSDNGVPPQVLRLIPGGVRMKLSLCHEKAQVAGSSGL